MEQLSVEFLKQLSKKNWKKVMTIGGATGEARQIQTTYRTWKGAVRKTVAVKSQEVAPVAVKTQDVPSAEVRNKV